jgi:ribosomal protein S18 acetylase RimI-like enzyme
MGIRQYQNSDQIELKKFILKVLKEFGYGYQRETDYDLDNPAQFYEIFYILEEADKIIGSIAIKNIGNEVAELKRLYVDHKYRGQGYGAKLLDLALKYSKEHQYYKVILDTSTNFDKAILLYKSRGFKLIHKKNKQIFMEKELT